MRKSKGDYSIQAVENAMRLLEGFREESELGVSELARRLGLHKNNVFRLLATLEELEYIEQCTDSDRYRLGLRSLELGLAFGRGRDLVRSSVPALEGLVAGCGESAHLAVLRDLEVVHLDGRWADRLVLTGSRVGRRLPAHCTALGKALLAGSSEAVRQDFERRHVAGGKLPRHTASTIEDPIKFFEHLRGVAVRGFSIDLEECEPGLCCAAAPIFDGSGRIVAALSVSGPSFRCSEERLLDELAPLVVAASERVSHDLGFCSA